MPTTRMQTAAVKKAAPATKLTEAWAEAMLPTTALKEDGSRADGYVLIDDLWARFTCKLLLCCSPEGTVALVRDRCRVR